MIISATVHYVSDEAILHNWNASFTLADEKISHSPVHKYEGRTNVRSNSIECNRLYWGYFFFFFSYNVMIDFQSFLYKLQGTTMVYLAIVRIK